MLNKIALGCMVVAVALAVTRELSVVAVIGMIIIGLLMAYGQNFVPGVIAVAGGFGLLFNHEWVVAVDGIVLGFALIGLAMPEGETRPVRL